MGGVAALDAVGCADLHRHCHPGVFTGGGDPQITRRDGVADVVNTGGIHRRVRGGQRGTRAGRRRRADPGTGVDRCRDRSNGPGGCLCRY